MTKTSDANDLNNNDLAWFYLNLCPDEISKVQALIKHPRSLERQNPNWRPPSYQLTLPYDDGWSQCQISVRKTKLATSFSKYAKRHFSEYARLGNRNLYLASATLAFHRSFSKGAITLDWETLTDRALGLINTALGPIEAPYIQLNAYSSSGTTLVVNWFCDSTGTAYPDYDSALTRVQQAYHAAA